MCGIAGFVDRSGAPANREILLRMLRRIEHRGPDGGAWLEDDGFALRLGDRHSPQSTSQGPSRSEAPGEGLKIALGHQRLAITDLSEAGRQPMSRANGRWWIVFNGAIYNALELRSELRAEGQEFSSATDTEVLLAAYIRWGAQCLERFNGMWAFAIWDSQRRELFCARDRFGIKPFYYTESGSAFAFASEPKALQAVRAAAPNVPLARMYLANGAATDGVEATCYEGYRCLPGGSFLTIDERGLRIEPWYRLDERASAIAPPAALPEAAERLRALLRDAVALRLRADVPVGLMLSGGVDSSGIAGILAQRSGGDGFSGKTISTCYPTQPDIDESSYIRTILESTGLSGDFIEVPADKFEEDLNRFMTTADGLPPSSVFYAEWRLYRRARELGLPVMLSGQGSDELFAGYEPWDVYTAQEWNRGARLRPLSEAVLSGRRRWGLLRGARHAAGVLRNARRPFPCGCATDGTLGEHQRHLFALDYLPVLLAFEDRNSMAWGIESRLPFLDYRVVEFARALPDRFLLRRGWTKVVLRAALKGLVPERVLRRKTKLGLPGPFESPARAPLIPIRDIGRRLVSEGYIDAIPSDEKLRNPHLRLRIRIFDAWMRCCLGGGP